MMMDDARRSVDSVRARALAAEARLRDFNEAATARQRRAPAGAELGVLPSVTDAFDEVWRRGAIGRRSPPVGSTAAHHKDPHNRPRAQVEGPPAFLDPEATRPIATSTAHGVGGVGMPAATAVAKPGATAGAGFDVAKLAPLLKGQKRRVCHRGCRSRAHRARCTRVNPPAAHVCWCVAQGGAGDRPCWVGD